MMRAFVRGAVLTALVLGALGAAGVLAGSAQGAAGQRLQQVFEQANNSYFRGEHKAAIEGYRRLVQAGVRDADVQYNLATAHAQAGNYGRAVLHFERALRLRPGDEQAERGLETVQRILAGRRAEASGGSATTQTGPPLEETLVRPLSEDLLAWALLGFDLLLFALLLAGRLLRSESARLALGIAAPLLAVGLLLSGAGLAVKTGALRDGEPAVIVEGQAAVREAPHPRAPKRTQAHEGQRTRVLDRQEEFVRVQLSGREGWVEASKVETI
jgi:tetratricopeptide (TPR) repeat protein